MRLHVRDAAALYMPQMKMRLEPLYRRDGEAVFEAPAMPGRYVLYQIERSK